MSIEKVYDYFHNYNSKTYQVFACMGNEPLEKDILNFEKQYDISLPNDFREFTMSPLGGLYMEVREELWPRAKVYDVAPFWTFCRGIMVYGIAKGIPDYLDIRVKTKELHDEGLEDYIPFFSIIGDGNTIFCFDKNNRIVVLDWYSKVAFEEDEMNFSDFLLKKIKELEERKTQMIETLENRKN